MNPALIRAGFAALNIAFGIPAAHGAEPRLPPRTSTITPYSAPEQGWRTYDSQGRRTGSIRPYSDPRQGYRVFRRDGSRDWGSDRDNQQQRRR